MRRYVHGPGTDEPIVWYEGGTTANKNWLYSDHLGSIVATANTTGASTATYTYGPYGEPNTTGGLRFRYTGQQLIGELGLYYYKARFYSPALGRFLQTDPIGYKDDQNLYAYVGSNSVNMTDPSGLSGVVTGQRDADSYFAQVQGQQGVQVAQLLPAPLYMNPWTVGPAVAATGCMMSSGCRDAVAGVGSWVMSEGADKPSLLDPKGEAHVLDGDATGGGHAPGTGNPGKSEFPNGWSRDKITGEISDVATDPNSTSSAGRNGRTVVNGTRDGVNIQVIVEPSGRIVTGYPTNVPRNPR